jgi:hypothetical protein
MQRIFGERCARRDAQHDGRSDDEDDKKTNAARMTQLRQTGASRRPR